MAKDRNQPGAVKAIAAGAAAARGSVFGQRGSRQPLACMADVNRLGELIDKILSVGDAIILARTSDGGAVAITLMRDREREKAYASDQAELDELVSAMWDQYGGTETSA